MPMTQQTQRGTPDNIDLFVVCVVLLVDDKPNEGRASYGISIVFATPIAL